MKLTFWKSFCRSVFVVHHFVFLLFDVFHLANVLIQSLLSFSEHLRFFRGAGVPRMLACKMTDTHNANETSVEHVSLPTTIFRANTQKVESLCDVNICNYLFFLVRAHAPAFLRLERWRHKLHSSMVASHLLIHNANSAEGRALRYVRSRFYAS